MYLRGWRVVRASASKMAKSQLSSDCDKYLHPIIRNVPSRCWTVNRICSANSKCYGYIADTAIRPDNMTSSQTVLVTTSLSTV